MRSFVWFGIVIMALVLVACTEAPHGDFDESPHDDGTVVDGHEEGDLGSSIYVYLNVDVTDPEVEELREAILADASRVRVEFTASSSEFSITPGRSHDLSACLLWDGPFVEVSGEPDIETAESIVEAVEPFEYVTLVDAPLLGIGLDVVGDEGENMIEMCDSRRVTLRLDPGTELDLRALREKATVVPGVLGSSTNTVEEPPFTPDLSSYPTAQACYPPPFDSMTVYVEDADAEISARVVSEFQDEEGVVGFFGTGIDPALDPITRWEMTVFEDDESFYEENCVGIEVHVELAGEITDEEAAVVVARAKGIDGVADVQLSLTEASDPGECESDRSLTVPVALPFLPDTLVDPCFVSSSRLIIYRGDASVATEQAVCEALCLLPGVLDIFGEGYGRGPADGIDELSSQCGSFQAESAEPSDELVIPQDLESPVVDGVARSSGGSPAPDILESVLCDDDQVPPPLGPASDESESIRLDFLFEFCQEECFRDAHFIDPDDPDMGSGPFAAGAAFHIRHGFVNEGEQPLGPGFDVVIYVTPINQFENEENGPIDRSGNVTYRYRSDYVLRGTSERCGPGYGTQTGPVSCEWFVHEFDDGLPAGRHAIWAVWEAPCSAWVDYGFTDACADPNEVISLFSSGVDSPFEFSPPRYDEARESSLEGNDL